LGGSNRVLWYADLSNSGELPKHTDMIEAAYEAN
jgi:hypothetical protein